MSPQTSGYRQVPINSSVDRKWPPVVHRLVADAFIPPVSGKTEVNHRNGNKADNRVINLEWVSKEENNKHSVDSGLRHPQGVHHRANISVADVHVIRGRSSVEANSLSERFGISVTQIRNIQNGKSWKHIPRVSIKRMKRLSC